MIGKAGLRGATISLVAILVGGCASVERSPGIAEVQSRAGEHGIATIHWRQGGDADAAVDASIKTMLADDLTVDEAVQISLLNNRELQSVYENLRIAQADVVQAGLLRNPVFDGSVRFNSGGGGNVVDLGIAFDFLDIFFIPMRKSVAASQYERSKLDVTGSVIDLAGMTKQTYFELQGAEQKLEARKTSLAAFEASYDFAKRIREAGNSTRLRLASERVLLEEAKLGVVDAETKVVELHEELNRLMGLFGSSGQWKITHRLPEVTEEAIDASSLEAKALEHSLDLQLVKADLDIAAKRLGITKPLGVLSDMEVGATAERDGKWSVGPSVSLPVPIFSQGQTAVAKADAELRQAMNRYQSTAIEVRSSVRSAYAKLQAARGRAIHYQKTVLPLRELIVNETQKEYNAMLVGAFELLQARRDQVDAGAEYIQSLQDYWSAKARLEQIVSGRLVRGRVPGAMSIDSTGGH